MPKIAGAKRHAARLAALPARTRAHVGQAIFVGANQIETEARLLIVTGAIQGAGHIPSLPGEPPNRDTGQLDQSIVALKTGDMTAEASVNAPYAVALELGTSRMAERPYMRPAVAKERPAAVRKVRDAINRVIAASG